MNYRIYMPHIYARKTRGATGNVPHFEFYLEEIKKSRCWDNIVMPNVRVSQSCESLAQIGWNDQGAVLPTLVQGGIRQWDVCGFCLSTDQEAQVDKI